MALIIILDSNPLSNSVVPFAAPGQTPTYSERCRQWIEDCERAGAIILVPAITYYEALRELERRRATAKIARLRAFTFSVPGRFIPLNTAHLEAAAKLWANSRNAGMPVASTDALDADVILAAQALSLGLDTSDFVVATTNPKHLSRFVPADIWSNIS